ncbi:aminotransferase class IV [Melioribacteraceae bacterium 4301-Me]|uniref:aminotransferase class IV n=1 Tax=Pyranulibacter aquaticus TaxID=3163344 RepID=UPI00359B5F21
MCRLIESIKVYRRKLWNIKYHNYRMNNSRRQLFGAEDEIDLSKEIVVPQIISNELYKCRVVYSNKILSVEFIPYLKKKITSLEIVTNNLICYDHKYENREEINKLLYSKRCDEILIVKNNLITDASFANVVLSDGKVYLTPASPLLKGTKRAKLLEEGLIKEEEIPLSDLRKFKYAYLINAMLDLEESNKVLIENIMQ